MNNDALQAAETILSPWAAECQNPEPTHLMVTLSADDLLPAVMALANARWGYLAAITGLDLVEKENSIEILYQFCAGPALLTLRVRVARDGGEVPSLCPVLPSANILERELREMFGVRVRGLPDTGYLFLPDDWPKDRYPLRKDTL